MTNPSIAFCISGQIRTSFAEMQEIALEAESIGADVFISVWSTRGGKTFAGAVGPKNIRRIIGDRPAQLLPDNWLGRMRDIFPDFVTLFPPKPAVTVEELKRVFPNASIEIEDDGPEFDLDAGDSNSLRMLYKIWRANQLKRQAEKSRGARYSRVVRVRPDMVLKGHAILELPYNKHQIFVQGHAGDKPNYLNDTFWVASSEDDDALSALHQRCVAARNGGWLGIHRELSDVAVAAGLSARPANIVKNGIGDFGADNSTPLDIVRDKLFNAIVSGRLEQRKAGGPEFCALVRAVINKGKGWIDSGPAPQIDNSIIQLLAEVQNGPRNAYQQALMYICNIAVLDGEIIAVDRIELMKRVISYYIHRNAAVFLDVKIGDMSALFEDAPLALHRAVCYPDECDNELQSPIAQELLLRWESFWGNKLGESKNQVSQGVADRIISSPPFTIQLHQKLAKLGEHKKAYELAEKWVDLSPKMWRAYDLLSSSAQALGQPETACDILIAARQKTETHSRLEELIGLALLKIGQIHEAAQAFERSLSLPGCNVERVSEALEAVKPRL
ncbi:MAG: hypothetical protein COB08_003205 [Rhodobacteraceae bacterium]|nr:hypothetical protein [Paracoccaceae bacterium]